MDYKADKDQIPLFDLDPPWQEHWQGMPEYKQEDLEPHQTIVVKFKNESDRQEFALLIGQDVTESTDGIWFPKITKRVFLESFKGDVDAAQPRYPIYVISKGRWESRLTAKALDAMNVAYSIVVEPQEFEQYAAVIDRTKILVLPFSNLGQGSIPARNWVWEHAVQAGAARHWILDDNISAFNRMHDNAKWHVHCGSTFAAAEDFADRYTNVALCGFEYHGFAPSREKRAPFRLNTRIYSCILIDNALSLRWRGRYNEDTDLALRVLKAGLCTVLFTAFLIHKEQTLTMKGGNTDELYKDDGRLKMAQSLQEQHPDVVKITEKWGRPQHHVDYKQFRKNKLIPKPNLIIPQEIDNYGMELQVIEGGRK